MVCLQTKVSPALKWNTELGCLDYNVYFVLCEIGVAVEIEISFLGGHFSVVLMGVWPENVFRYKSILRSFKLYQMPKNKIPTGSLIVRRSLEDWLTAGVVTVSSILLLKSLDDFGSGIIGCWLSMKAGLSQSIDTLKHRVPVFMLKHLHCYSFHRKAVEGILGRCRCVGKRELPVSATCLRPFKTNGLE